MPSIPLYGYDELEPSMLNSAKRRIVGLLEMSQEALTQKSETDPTNGKQNTFLEKLTEEVYTTIKDIEVLDSYISESDGVDAKDLRAEIKKGASQIALVNNALRKISSIYEGLRPNIIYTDLKIFTYFVNSVIILKKTALRFFEIVDDLIDNVNKAKGINYIRPVINKDEDIEPEPPTSSTITPSIMDTATPNPALPDIPSPPIIVPPPRAPPPRKPYKGNFGKRMKAYQALITKLLQDNNIADQNEADLVVEYANDYVRNTGAFLIEQEIQDYIDTIQNPPQGTPISTGYSDQELQDLFVVAGKKAKDANFTPDEGIKLQTQIGNFLLGNKNTALPNDQELDNIIIDIMNARGSSSSSSNTPPPVSGVPIGITGVPATPLTGTPIPQDYADLRVRADVLKGDNDLTNQIGRTALTRNEGLIDDAIAKNKDFKATLNKYRKLVEYGEEPFLTYTTPLPPITKQERATLNGLATDYKQEKKKLTMKDKDKWRDAYKAFMVANKIPFTP